MARACLWVGGSVQAFSVLEAERLDRSGRGRCHSTQGTFGTTNVPIPSRSVPIGTCHGQSPGPLQIFFDRAAAQTVKAAGLRLSGLEGPKVACDPRGGPLAPVARGTCHVPKGVCCFFASGARTAGPISTGQTPFDAPQHSAQGLPALGRSMPPGHFMVTGTVSMVPCTWTLNG